MNKRATHFYEFGPFRLIPGERVLKRQEDPIALTPKCFDILCLLVENSGSLVEKEQLLKRIWPDSFVEEGNLTQSVSLLRKALGESLDKRLYIETIPRRGYRFVGDVREVGGASTSAVMARRSKTAASDEEETAESDESFGEAFVVPGTSREQRAEDAGSGSATSERSTWARLRSSAKLTSRSRLGSLVAAALVVAALVYLLLQGRFFPQRPPIKSLAVLPLKLLGGEAEAYLGLGIADTLISKLSQIGELTVRPTSAIGKYVNPEIDSLAIARQLKVESVLEGTLQRAGERLRITLNLLRVENGQSVWTDSFDIGFTDLFTVQDEVSKQVAAKLRIKLNTTEQAQMNKRYTTTSPEAYQYYLQGMHIREKGLISYEDLESATAKFKKAIQVDPNYALAFAQLAGCYVLRANLHQPEDPIVWLERAKEELNQASMLDPSLAEVHVVRSYMLKGPAAGYRIEEAIRELRRAQQLNPSVGHSDLAWIYAGIGLADQAIRESQRAIEIDPTNVANQNALALTYLALARHDEAITLFQQVLAIEPNDITAHLFEPWAFIYRDRMDEAQKKLDWIFARFPRSELGLSLQALIWALQGKFQEAEAQIPGIVATGQKAVSHKYHAYVFACIYALEGKSQEAVKWLRRTVEVGMPNYPMVASDPFLNGIRKDPAFTQFMAELKPRWEALEREFR